MRALVAVVFALVVVPSVVRAERLKLPGEIVLTWGEHRDRVDVRRGKTSLSLTRREPWPDVTIGTHVTASKDKGKITVEFEGNCTEGDTQVYTRAQLEALIEHVAGQDLARAGQQAEAIAALTRAHTLWAERDEITVELAAALLAAGRRDEAARALSPSVERDPLRAYALVAGDKRLAALLELPGLVAMRSPARRSGALRLPAWHPERRVIAVGEATENTMSEEERGTVALKLLDAATGKTVLESVPRAMLADLGFDEPLDEATAVRPDEVSDEEGAAKSSEHVVWKARFPSARIAVVCSDKAVLRVLWRDQLLGELRKTSCDTGYGAHRVWLVPGAVVSSGRWDVGDGCGGWVGDTHDVVPLRGDGPPAMQSLVAAASADRLLRGGDAHAAAEGLARAVALAPERPELRRRWAVALVRDRRVDEALKALAALSPVEMYWSALTEPQLAPLLDAPPLASLRRAQPGSATMWTGLAAARGWVAFRHDELSSESGGYRSWLRVAAADTGRAIVDLPIVEAGETRRCDGKIRERCIEKQARDAVRRRTELAARLLRDLGFDKPDGEAKVAWRREGDDKSDPEGPPWRATRGGLVVTCGKAGFVQVLRDGKPAAARRVECYDTPLARELVKAISVYPNLVLLPTDGEVQATHDDLRTFQVIPLKP